MAKTGWKQALDNIHLHNLLFQTQISSMGQQVVFNYPLVSRKVPTTLVTPYSYPMGHPSYSFVSKNGQKSLKQAYDDIHLHNLLFQTQICSRGQLVVLNYRSVSPKVPTRLVILYSYPMGHPSYSFVSKNGQKWLKTGFWQYLHL
jgi:hypothetical protein